MRNKEELKAEQKEYFTRKAVEWNQEPDKYREGIDHVVSTIGMKGNERVLDVGTGIGIVIPSYEKVLTTGSVLAFDYTPKMIEVAKERYPKEQHPKVDFEVLDLYGLEFDSEFDVVVCYSCFPHFIDQEKAVMILSRSLKEGGKFVVTSLSSNSRMKMKMEQKHDHIEHYHISAPDLISLMAGHGLHLTYAQIDSGYDIIIGVKKGNCSECR